MCSLSVFNLLNNARLRTVLSRIMVLAHPDYGVTTCGELTIGWIGVPRGEVQVHITA